MARINKGALSRLEIIREASRQFLEKGYSSTTVTAIAKALEMSPGNLTFYFPTKEHLLAELVEALCSFQWKMMEEEANEGYSSVMAICLELTSMAAAAEADPIIMDFFISAYQSRMCLGVIRKNDAARATEVFRSYCPDWTREQFLEAELLVSGIEYATLIDTGEPVTLETRISGALNNILSIYGIPEAVRRAKLQKVFAMDYRSIGRRTLAAFKTYVEDANDQALQDLIKR